MTDAEMNAEWERLKSELRQRKAHAMQLATAARPVRMHDARYPHLAFLVSPDMAGDTAWRVTTFSNGQPWGHTGHRSAYDAFFDVLQSGAVPMEQRA